MSNRGVLSYNENNYLYKKCEGENVYQVLFAEDELLVRLGLQNSIPWEKYNMKLAAQADNGLTAFELFQQLRPDVILTDIRMEGMDGYELIQRIREIDEDCAIIVISCLDDFETLRKMIQYNIIGYILKASMSMDEIYEMLQKAKEYLELRGRKGIPESAEEKNLQMEDRLHRYFGGEETIISVEEERSIKNLLDFYLREEDQTKINELAMKFVYELVSRSIPEGILVETGEKEFVVLLSEYVDSLEERIDRINRSVEGFLGVDFSVAQGKREQEESLRNWYLRIRGRRKAENPEERQWDKMIQKAVHYMREHYQESLSLQEISGILGLSPSYFSHFFKKETGINYIEFLNEIRLEAVLRDLQTSKDKIAVVAEKNGFHNLEYFSRFFKKSMGISPAKWRQEHT